MKIFSMTDVGRKREMNQDYVFATDESLGTLPNLLVVADGMGGHKAGDFASKYTVEVLKEELKHTLKDGPEEILLTHNFIIPFISLVGIMLTKKTTN